MNILKLRLNQTIVKTKTEKGITMYMGPIGLVAQSPLKWGKTYHISESRAGKSA